MTKIQMESLQAVAAEVKPILEVPTPGDIGVIELIRKHKNTVGYRNICRLLLGETPEEIIG